MATSFKDTLGATFSTVSSALVAVVYFPYAILRRAAYAPIDWYRRMKGEPLTNVEVPLLGASEEPPKGDQ